MSSDVKEALEKFINHCTYLENDDDPSGDGFTREFQVLRKSQIEEKEENKFPTEAGKKDCNIKKNRYKDILPFDYTRVKLEGNEEDGSDYINASYIKDVNGKNGYIACQGPLPHTVQAFWQMLWEKKIEIVFMSCKLEEGIPPKKRCQKYWAEAGEEEEFGDFTVKLEDEQTLGEDFVKRYLIATKGSETHHVTQFHYSGWPDHDIPDRPGAINFMISEMRLAREKPDIPLVIHCSAGCGRTGTICAIDYIWTLFNQRKIGEDFNLFEIVKKIREQRQSMVQTPDQYKLVHLVMKDLFERWIENYNIDNDVSGAENLYANVKDDVSDYVNVELPCESVYVDVDIDVDEKVDEDNTYTDVSGEGVVIVSQQAASPVQRNPSVRSNKDQVSSPPGSRSPLTSTSSAKSTHSDEAVNNVYLLAKPIINTTKPKRQEGVERVDHVPKDAPMLPDRNYNIAELKSSGVEIVETQKWQDSHVRSDTSSRSGYLSAAPKPHYKKHHFPTPPQNTGFKHHPPSIISTRSDAGSHKTVINVGRYLPTQTVTKLSIGKQSLMLPNRGQTHSKSSHQFRGQDMSYPVRLKKIKEPTQSTFSGRKKYLVIHL